MRSLLVQLATCLALLIAFCDFEKENTEFWTTATQFLRAKTWKRIFDVSQRLSKIFFFTFAIKAADSLCIEASLTLFRLWKRPDEWCYRTSKKILIESLLQRLELIVYNAYGESVMIVGVQGSWLEAAIPTTKSKVGPT